jgi:NADH-quinone oxidoreductase subunit C
MTDAPTAEAPESAEPAPEPETLHGCPVAWSRGQQVVHVTRDGYVGLLEALAADGFDLCSDLSAVDYLAHPGRALPDGIDPERFEVVLNLTHLHERRRLRVRLQVPEDEPVVPSAFDIWPGTDAMEREVFDLFGISFEGHPDLTRILMPEDWIGNPLRKDYEVGRIPVQFKDAPETR